MILFWRNQHVFSERKKKVKTRFEVHFFFLVRSSYADAQRDNREPAHWFIPFKTNVGVWPKKKRQMWVVLSWLKGIARSVWHMNICSKLHNSLTLIHSLQWILWIQTKILNCSPQLRLLPQHKGFWNFWDHIVSAIAAASATLICNFSQYQDFWSLWNQNHDHNLKPSFKPSNQTHTYI